MKLILLAAMTAVVVSCVTGEATPKGIMAHYTADNTGWHRADGSSYINPVAPTPASVAAGRELFMGHCALCHGTKGKGDGPRAASMNPAPANLVGIIPSKTDSYLFLQISQGRVGMPIWKESFRKEQVWHIVNFLRELPTLN